MQTVVSCQKAADALGVSVSTVKRLCDEGVLISSRTPGGHRRIRKSDLALVTSAVTDIQAEAPGPASGHATPLDVDAILDYLLSGNIALLVERLTHLRNDGLALPAILDELIAPTMWLVGQLWEDQTIDVYQEHLCAKRLREVLQELKSSLPTPSTVANAPLAIGGAIGSEQHDLASEMVELVMKDAGLLAMSLGSSVPLISLHKAIQDYQPKLVWLSYTVAQDPEQIVSDNQALCDVLPAQTKLIIGGRGLTESIRRRLVFDFYGDQFRQLSHYVSRIQWH